MVNKPNNVYNSVIAAIPAILLKNTYNLNGAGVSAISNVISQQVYFTKLKFAGGIFNQEY
ncbi:hypothetical protein [Nostoc sp. UHCC 0302]|uniref:hypothetical protein n=1 Tax=Nostoc sp. UHCC 0302 TaxID=3134896 RepID=UPI00311CAD59